MKKSVLASIKPKYCELIASGKKTVEIRKNRPKIDVPFKVYIYCTSSDIHSALVVNSLKTTLFRCCNYKTAIPSGGKIGNGKVIGEFVCDMIDDFFVYEDGAVQNWNYIKLSQSCLKYTEIAKYIGFGKFGYAWHISDLVIYDKPKELSEFLKYNRTEDECYYQHLRKPNSCRECMRCVLERPPQNWCYVDELEETT